MSVIVGKTDSARTPSFRPSLTRSGRRLGRFREDRREVRDGTTTASEAMAKAERTNAPTASGMRISRMPTAGELLDAKPAAERQMTLKLRQGLVVIDRLDARQRLVGVERGRRGQPPLERGRTDTPRVGAGDLLSGESHAHTQQEHERAERGDVGAGRGDSVPERE